VLQIVDYLKNNFPLRYLSHYNRTLITKKSISLS